MAFWGAPLNDPDHVRHALSAARAIAASVASENLERRSRGRKPLRLRIGIHTGKVVVGNIGGEERQNYTMVGDAVKCRAATGKSWQGTDAAAGRLRRRCFGSGSGTGRQ
ncbi:MAG: adenylate/guanylate cyclase domain-containing protein [Nitratireductor sp.]